MAKKDCNLYYIIYCNCIANVAPFFKVNINYKSFVKLNININYKDVLYIFNLRVI